MALARGAAADEVDGQVVAQAQEESAFIAQVFQQRRTAGHFDEQLLHDVAGVGLVAEKVRQKRKHGGRVGIV